MITDLEEWERDWHADAGEAGPRDRIKRRWLHTPKHARHEAITAAGDAASWADLLEALEYAEKYGPPGWTLSFASASIGHERSHTRVSWRVVWITEAEAERRMTVRQQRPRGGAKRSSMT